MSELPSTQYEQRLDQERQRCHRLIEDAEKVVAELKPGLERLAEVIKAQKPDSVVVIDKGARLLGTPLAKFIKQCSLELPELSETEVIFYNDSTFKDKLALYDDPTDAFTNPIGETTETLFKHVAGKKVLFVDEFVFTGEGARAALILSDYLDVAGTYFALEAFVDNHNHGNVGAADTAEVAGNYHPAFSEVARDERVVVGMPMRENIEHRDFFDQISQLYIRDDSSTGEYRTAPNTMHLNAVADFRALHLQTVAEVKRIFDEALVSLA